MVLLIFDQKCMSGKTTTARDFLKDKNFVETSCIQDITCPFPKIDPKNPPEWIVIDPCTTCDIQNAQELSKQKYFYFKVRFSREVHKIKMPNFLLVTNNHLTIK